jgi:hypothetical protein
MFPSEYLKHRVSKVVLDSDKIFNEGARLLAHYPSWESELEGIVEDAWDTLLRYCIRSKNTTYSAAVKLTFASDLIGKRIARTIDIDSTNIKSTLALGDILLESFLQDNLIEIYREYEGIKAPYMVRITNQSDDIKPILIGTSFEPLPPITGLISPVTKEPFIKGWSNNALFKEYLDKPFISALENLRNTAWELNLDVLHILEINEPADYLELTDRHGVIYKYYINQENKLPKKLKHMDGTEFLWNKDARLQKLMSKNFEYNQVVTKAGMIRDAGNVFYQEVSCDYRGRVYYAESFLEFQGSDIARSLFKFYKKKEVNEEGYRWMLIHAANCYNASFTIDELSDMPWLEQDYASYLKEEGLETISLDKMTLNDRKNWAERNVHILRTYAKNMVVNFDAEKPYSLYAVCIEIDKYLEAKKHNVPFMSGLPIPVDGSNNGKQTCRFKTL